MRAILAFLLVVAASAANACTTFCAHGLFGRNYDFETGHGHVIVNKRNMQKSSATAKPAQWTSRYGSVTFNQFGRDNATGGMNEKGLVVELMWLDGTRYPAADARPELGTLEWIQYQLDTAATVQDVIANTTTKVRISQRGVPLHYLVADATGDVATIEFLEGKLVVHRGDALPAPVLANDTYAWSLQNDTTRFARAAQGVKTATTVAAAFALLDAVAQSHTQWSIVYDIRNRAIAWRTKDNRDARTIRFADLDFSCARPVRVLDIHEGKGDVARLFHDYSTAANIALIRNSTRATTFLKNTSDADIEKDGRFPEGSSCATAPAVRGTRSATTHRR
jgi:penicillin V acylase-like amidase (Ntn superfamily)